MEDAAPARHSAFSWDGLVLRCRTVLSGVDLEPKWALVRARKALEERGAKVAGSPDAGDLGFDETLTRVSMPGAFLPYTVSGDIRAQRVPEGLAVTASANLTGFVFLLLAGLVTITIFFSTHAMNGSWLHWSSLGGAVATTALHMWQTAEALRRMTTAATTL